MLDHDFPTDADDPSPPLSWAEVLMALGFALAVIVAGALTLAGVLR